MGHHPRMRRLLILNEGKYTVSVIVNTAGGCADTAVMVKAIVTNNKPASSFSASPRDACAKTSIKFKDESTGNPSKWLWVFGDGTTSAPQNP